MKPNVVIINPDQMRADAVRHLGNEAAYTPYLDALAEEGVSFAHATCQNPVCVPSRCSFLTGLYPHTRGHRTMSYLLQPEEENLFSDMKNAGYYTVSSTRGDFMAGQFPRYHKRLIDHYLMVERPKKRPPVPENRRGEPGSDTFYSFMNGIIPTDSPSEEAINIDDLTVDAALRFIRQRPADKPFFLFLGLTFPHPPYQIEQKYYDLIDAQKLPPRIAELAADKPKMEQALRKELGVAAWSEERFDELRRVYLAMCAKVDDQLGRVLACLKSEGIYDDTAVLFFSDHGDYTGDYGIVEKAQNCFPECLTRVPLVIKPPKDVPVDPGVNENLVELTDVCATVADLSGITADRQNFSKSLLPTIRNKYRQHRAYTVCEGGRLPEEAHCSEFSAESFSQSDLYAPRQSIQSRNTGEHTKAAMIRTTQYKYVRRIQEEDEFYILAEGENTNHINDPFCAEEIAAHKEAMLDWYMRTCDLVPQSPDDRFTFEFLENNMTAMGIPKAASKAIKLWLRLRGESAGQFADKMRRKTGH